MMALSLFQPFLPQIFFTDSFSQSPFDLHKSLQLTSQHKIKTLINLKTTSLFRMDTIIIFVSNKSKDKHFFTHTSE